MNLANGWSRVRHAQLGEGYVSSRYLQGCQGDDSARGSVSSGSCTTSECRQTKEWLNRGLKLPECGGSSSDAITCCSKKWLTPSARLNILNQLHGYRWDRLCRMVAAVKKGLRGKPNLRCQVECEKKYWGTNAGGVRQNFRNVARKLSECAHNCYMTHGSGNFDARVNDIPSSWFQFN